MRPWRLAGRAPVAAALPVPVQAFAALVRARRAFGRMEQAQALVGRTRERRSRRARATRQWRDVSLHRILSLAQNRSLPRSRARPQTLDFTLERRPDREPELERLLRLQRVV